MSDQDTADTHKHTRNGAYSQATALLRCHLGVEVHVLDSVKASSAARCND